MRENSSASVRLRPARPEDAAAVRDIYAPFVRDSPATFRTDVPSVERVADEIRETRTADEYPWYVAVRDGENGRPASEGENDGETARDVGVDGETTSDVGDDVPVDRATVVGYAYGSQLRDRPAYRWAVETSIYVDPANQRDGVGTRLYDRLLGTLRQQGYCSAFAALGMPNPESAAFHERHGFERVGRFPAAGFKLGEWHDVVWYHRRLSDPDGVPPEPRPLSAVDDVDGL